MPRRPQRCAHCGKVIPPDRRDDPPFCDAQPGARRCTVVVRLRDRARKPVPNRATPRAKGAASYRVVGHDGDPAHLDELLPGSFLAVQHAGPHRIDRDVPKRPAATLAAKTYLAQHPPKSAAAFLNVSHVPPSGAVVPLARWEPEQATRPAGSWRWVPARLRPTRRELSARLEAHRPKGPPAGYIPWRKEQRALFFAPELATVAGDVAPEAYSPPMPWLPLRRSGEWNRAIRDAVSGLSGVYAIRETRNPATVLYVGESHTRNATEARKRPGAKRREKGTPKPQPLRWWKTIKRHFYRWSIPEWHKSDHARAKRQDEWVHLGKSDLDVALWTTAPGDAQAVEGDAIRWLKPLHNSLRFVPSDEPEPSSREDLEEAPF